MADEGDDSVVPDKFTAQHSALSAQPSSRTPTVTSRDVFYCRPRLQQPFPTFREASRTGDSTVRAPSDVRSNRTAVPAARMTALVSLSPPWRTFVLREKQRGPLSFTAQTRVRGEEKYTGER